MNPLARWTIGNTNECGVECLRYSTRCFKRLYPQFDIVICYNNLSPFLLEKVKSIGFDTYEQKASDLDYPLENHLKKVGWRDGAPGDGWKHCPPRLRIDSHELWLDNDVVIHGRLQTLEKWLESDNKAIISTGHKRCYGEFDKYIKPTCCAGFFGLQAGLNFEQEIIENCRKVLNGKPLGGYDEQGVVVKIATNQPHIIVPMEELKIVKEVFPVAPGMHFIGLNRSNPHQHWELFKKHIIKC